MINFGQKIQVFIEDNLADFITLNWIQESCMEIAISERKVMLNAVTINGVIEDVMIKC